ncbi:MAG: Uma2 family endonuclease [Cyanobacteria bacterium P01_D01_bin.44]
MQNLRRPIEQTDPPRPPKETLPTMYDLPSENPEEPGLPDEFHYLQPQLLSATLRLTRYSADQVFSVGDMNLYYDSRHPYWYKRPDWFAVMGVPRLYDNRDMRLSYVVWQEGPSPFVVVELLSPGTEKEDLGETQRGEDGIPTKWEVYEQILRVPYYVVFDRYSNRFRAFHLVGGHYQALDVSNQRFLIPEWGLNLGIWQGIYQGIERSWLRWYNAAGELILTDTEQLEATESRAVDAESRAERLAQQLRSLGIDPEDMSNL